MKENELKVTYLLFAYNHSKYIDAAIESAVNQTYSNIEYIISDDFSNDDTYEKILNNVSKTERNIRINRNNINLGIGRHFNLLLSWSTGSLVIVAAGDDISEKNRVEKLVDLWIKNGKPLLIGSSISLIDEFGYNISDKLFANYVHEFDKFTNLNARKFIEKDFNQTIAGCTLAYSRSLITKFPIFDKRIQTEDIVWIFRAYLLGDIYIINEKLVRYRIHSQSYSGNKVINNDEQKKIAEKFGSLYYTILFAQFLVDARYIYQNTGDTKLLPIINLLEKIVNGQEIIHNLNLMSNYISRSLASAYYFFQGELSFKDFCKFLLLRSPSKFKI
jgi:glycosyltransferase involved in cell wall biosynthesis